MKTIYYILALSLVCLNLGSATAHAENVRVTLQKAAATQDPDFPDGTTKQLTHFSITCELNLKQTKLYVVDQRAVLTGMLAPRGENKISFFNEKHKFMGSLRYIQSRPLWCEGSKVFLFGGWDAAMPSDSRCASGNDCNVIDWSESTEDFKLIHEKRYGSSGGISDP